jgi:hypothetical protein
MRTNEVLVAILMYAVLPLWLAAGFADYLCHRASHIERTSGWKESVLHLVQFGEMAVPVLAALFLEINSGVILVMMAFLILHEATAIWDVRYASATREVSPTEQHVHSVLEMLPFTGLLLVIALHWPDFTALFGFGRPDFSFMLKQQPIPVAYVVTMLTLTALLEVLPIWKSWRAGCVTIGRARIKWANAGSMTRQEPKGGTTTTGLPSAVGLAGRALRPKRNWQQSPCTASVVTWHDAMIGIAPYKMRSPP